MIEEYPSVYRHESPKARKMHKCCECGGVIAIGEIYHIHVGVWDCEFSSYKRCLDCENLAKEIDATIKDPEDKTAFGMLHEQVFDGNNLDYKQRFIAIKRKRGGLISEWMAKYELPKPV